MASITATLLRKTYAFWANAMPKGPSRHSGNLKHQTHGPVGGHLVAALAIAALSACGGGSNDGTEPLEDAPIASVSPADTAAPASLQYCTRVPTYPRAANVHEVRDYGATPDDDRDDSDAIQRALDALQPGDTLVFAPGRYL